MQLAKPFVAFLLAHYLYKVVILLSHFRYSKISDGAFQLLMTKEELNRPLVFRATVYQRSFCATHCVRAIN